MRDEVVQTALVEATVTEGIDGVASQVVATGFAGAGFVQVVAGEHRVVFQPAQRVAPDLFELPVDERLADVVPVA